MEYSKHNSKRGVTLVYVIMALITITFIGMGLVRLTRSDAMTSLLGGASESARESVRSGFVAAADTINSTNVAWQDSLLRKIMYIYGATSYDSIEAKRDSLWLIGNETTWATIGSGDTRQRYRVALVGFDKTTHNATVRVDGRGKGRSTASAYGVYWLQGFGVQADTTNAMDWGNENAIYLGNATVWFHGSFDITGNMYLGGDTRFDGYLNGTVVRGKFRLDSPSERLIQPSPGPNPTMTFKGPAYFNCPIKSDGAFRMVFEDNVGFERPYTMQQKDTMKVYKNLYTNSTIVTQYGWDVSIQNIAQSGSSKIYYKSGYTYKTADDAQLLPITSGYSAYVNVGGTAMNLLDTLQMSPNQCQINFDFTKIDPTLITDWTAGLATTFDGTMANSWYASKPKWGNGFVVIKLTSTMVVGAGAKFGGKIIVITNGQKIMTSAGGSIFDMEDNANFTILNNGGQIADLGAPSSYKYRGLIWSNGGTQVVGNSVAGFPKFYGAMHMLPTANRVDWQPLGGEKMYFVYDPTVIAELDVNGFLVPTNCGNSPSSPTITIDSTLIIADPTVGIDPVLRTRPY